MSYYCSFGLTILRQIGSNIKSIFRLLLFFVVISSFGILANAQAPAREKKILILQDTVTLDTLSIVPESILIFDRPASTEPLLEVIDGTPMVKADSSLIGKKIKISYRVFPIDFSKTYKNKDTTMIMNTLERIKNPFKYTAGDQSFDIFSGNTLQKTGSISRGVRIGNNQDLSVNSTLNLQLSGKLTNNINISASLTDQNIPIQPEGNTQNLQEFDQVFIQLFNDKFKLRAGDFVLNKAPGYFMQYNKKAQGLSIEGYFKPFKSDTTAQLNVRASGALSRGKFSRNVFIGTEGNQGPYRLKGTENEPFIIILSGTERVYLDGALLKRGQEHDYTINYNTAEITFTTKRLITKDARIVVEFQYSDQNYARSLFETDGVLNTEKWEVWWNAYSEQDAKNQTLQQDLSDQQKVILSQAGDDVFGALSPTVNETNFSDNQVNYNLIDTLGFDSVLVFTNSNLGDNFTATFSQVGQGNGNYVLEKYTAVGKIFKWVAPVNGVPQGNYEPVIILITPKMQQLFTLGSKYKPNENNTISFSGAFSNQDRNTFSDLDGGDDQGLAFKFNYTSNNPIRNDTTPKWRIITSVDGEAIHKDFNPIERFRTVEFLRNWNMYQENIDAHQFIGKFDFTAVQNEWGRFGTQAQAFSWGEFLGLQSGVFANINTQKGFRVNLNTSWVGSERDGKNTFIRHKIDISQRIWKFRLGYKDEIEYNRKNNGTYQNLQANYRFYDWQAYVESEDTSRFSYRLFYRQRIDDAYDSTQFVKGARANSIGGTFTMNQVKNTTFSTTVQYRKLDILNTELLNQKPENTLLGRVELNGNYLKGGISFRSYYEVGSGLELKKEFIYIEVGGAQGVYAWNDYNNDNIKDLDEFEIAVYQDEANYIRVFVPSSDYIQTYTNQFQQSISIRPERWWRKKDGFLGVLSRFSTQTSYRADQKLTPTDPVEALNPFVQNISDTALISSNTQLRNTLFFNRVSPKFGMNYTYQESTSKILLANGFDARYQAYHQVDLRWNIVQPITFKLKSKAERKKSSADYTTNRNYFLEIYSLQPSLVYQPGTFFRVSLLSDLSYKENVDEGSDEIARIYDNGVEARYTQPKIGNIQASFNYILIQYNGESQTPLGFEMLNSLKPGNNFTWTLTFQRKIADNLQLSLQYNGRKSKDVKTIHSGGIELRAFF